MRVKPINLHWTSMLLRAGMKNLNSLFNEDGRDEKKSGKKKLNI
jgi:hypothetical protein